MPAESIPIETWMESHRVTVEPVDEATIVGVGHALDACRSIVGRLRYAGEVAAAGASIPRGILLAGAPGTGKTLTARWLVGQLGPAVACYNLPTEALDPTLIRDAFAWLAARPRSVVLLPEIDAIGVDRVRADRDSRRSLYATLEGLDGIVAIAPDRGPIVIATSNREVYALDDALVRPGRLGVHVRFSMPSEAERIELFRVLSDERPQEEGIDWSRMAALTRDWTPAAIRAAIDDGYGLALLRDGAGARLGEADVLGAIRRAGEIESDGGDGAASTRERVAVHEAGHVAVAAALGLPVVSVRIGPRKGEGRTETGHDGIGADDAELRASLVVALGGAASERAVLGEASLGSLTDVKAATRLLIERIESGLDEGFTPVSRSAFGSSEWSPVPRAIDDQLGPYVMARLAAARATAWAIVAGQSVAIAAFARSILAADMLAGTDLANAMEAVGWQNASHRAADARWGEGERVA